MVLSSNLGRVKSYLAIMATVRHASLLTVDRKSSIRAETCAKGTNGMSPNQNNKITTAVNMQEPARVFLSDVKERNRNPTRQYKTAPVAAEAPPCGLPNGLQA